MSIPRRGMQARKLLKRPSMKAIFVSLTVAVAIGAGVAIYAVRSADKPGRIAKQSEPGSVTAGDAKAIGDAMARELDRLQNLRRIQEEIAVQERELARAESIVKDWDEAMKDKSPSQTEREVMNINIARATDARSRLANLKAQAASLLAAK